MKNNRKYRLLLAATFILLCLPQIAWPDEKQGSSSSSTLLSVSESKRMIGFLIMGGNLDTHQTIAKGKEAGFEFMELGLGWEDVEQMPGTYSHPTLDNADRIFPSFRLKVYLGIEPINNVNSRLPKDLKGKPFDDPEVIERYKRVIDYALSRTQKVEILGIIVGNEIEAHLKGNQQKWDEYTRFFQAVYPYIKSRRPDLPIGVKAGMDGYLKKNTEELQNLNQYADIVLANYFPMGGHIDGHAAVEDPSVVERDFSRLVGLYPDKIINFMEIGYPTSAYLGSSEEKQAEFIRQVFKAWDKYEGRIYHMHFNSLHDLRPSHVRKMSEIYHSSDKALLEYLASGGLRTVDGKDKKAFKVLKEELRKRNWPQESKM
jgi:hypothetical protein